MGAFHLSGTVLPAGAPRDLFIADGRITFAEVDDAVTISEGGWITPGLVDAHAHLAMASLGSPATIDDAVRASAAAQLAAGVLLVREPGSPAGHAADDLGAGLPRTITAGHFLAPPGRYFPGLAREVDEASLPAVAAEEARPGGWVKIVGDFLDDGGRVTPNWSQAALADAAAAAHEAGARITMHATIPASIEGAIEAGFDAVEHGHGATTEHLQAMAAAGIALVPTLLIGDYIRQLTTELPLHSEDRATWLREVDVHLGVALAAHDAGVAVYAGTDAGAVDHGLVASEIALLRDAGLPGAAALAAGSWAARTWLGLPGLEVGAPADLVVFPDDPREDPEVLRHPSLIVLRGTMQGRP
ncbi:MAG: amidohydrolase family protein [Actinomycetota bacterium]|jgi:imidazolonepropionase-like amidohydrolase